MESAGRRDGRGGARVGTSGEKERRGILDQCRSSRVAPEWEETERCIRSRWKVADDRCAVSLGKLRTERAGEVCEPSVSAGYNGRRIGVQDQHAVAQTAGAKSKEICNGRGVVRNVSQRRRLRADERELRAGVKRAVAGQDAVRGLLPHAHRRQHSRARTARTRFPHHDIVRDRYAVEFVLAGQKRDAKTRGEEISREHESVAGRTARRLSGASARWQSLY